MKMKDVWGFCNVWLRLSEFCLLLSMNEGIDYYEVSGEITLLLTSLLFYIYRSWFTNIY
jgi:hypothetical protein